MDFTPPPDTGRGPSVTTDWEGFGDFSDFFGSIFGRPSAGRPGAGRAGADRAGVRMPIPGNDVEGELPLTLDDVLHGGQRRITVDGRSLDVTIPRGIRDGATLRLAGQGGPGVTGGPAGGGSLRARVRPSRRCRGFGAVDGASARAAVW